MGFPKLLQKIGWKIREFHMNNLHFPADFQNIIFYLFVEYVFT